MIGIRWFVVAAIAALLSGCATPFVPPNFFGSNVGLSQKKINPK